MKTALPSLLKILFFVLISLLPVAAFGVGDTGAVQRDHIEAELVAEVNGVQPGGSLRVGLRLRPDPNWHTYWRNPGDSGIPTEIDWDLPSGSSASPIAWPYPGAMPMGHLINYGYKGEHLLPATIEVPESLTVGDEFIVRADTSWLVCEEICIPGEAALQMTLPVLDQPPAVNAAAEDLFAWADQRRPRAVDWPARFSTEGGQLSLQIEPSGIANPSEWAFFSAQANLVDHSEPASATAGNGQILVAQKLSPYLASTPEALPFVLVDTVNERAFELTAQAGDLVSVGATTAAATPGWLVALGLALIGGVLLNLMPCVFPVLSIKAISLVSGAGQDQRAHGLAYTAGVLASFAALAAVLLLLRAGGEAIGWGFQLQSPLVIGILIYVLFALALSLSGLFDFGTRLMGMGQSLTDKDGLSGSFFTGILACVVASPCTAPFMGTALGAAILMPWPMAMAVFLALGVGLALPMLLLSFSPALAQRLPRPGPWMETFKQAMAFPLYLAVVWLLWVLARQTDPTGLAAVLVGLVVLAFALWLGARASRSPTLTTLRHAGVGLSLIAAVAALGAAIGPQNADRPGEASAWWEPYSTERLAELRDDPDRAVLVNMTADWCVTCLVNERVAINTDAVRQAMADHDVVYVKGDWTRRDPAITAYLSDYGRNGVPLYVLYPPNGGDARVLPQVLTPGLIVNAIENL